MNRRERGAVLAEFAFVLPLLVMLLLGIVEMGIAFNRAQAVEAAAREGARLGSLSTTTGAAIEARVDAALAGIPLDGEPSITVESPPGVVVPTTGRPCAAPNQQVRVTVTLEHEIDIPLIPLLPPTVNLTGQAVFRCEA